jgi:hypothetical protein
MITLFTEFENQNQNRRYPFEDDCNVTDLDGNQLPDDFLIDACLYGLNTTGTLWLHSINSVPQTIQINDQNGIVGTAPYQPGDRTAIVSEASGFGRQIGILVFGPGAARTTGKQGRTFAATSTPFCAAVQPTLNQYGVRGFVLPDGTLVNGHVTFEGQDGITVTTTSNTIRFDAIGALPPGPDECESDTPAIQCINVVREPGSAFLIGSTPFDASTINLSTLGFDSDDICQGRKGNRLPDQDGNLPNKVKQGDDPCDPTSHPVTPTADPGAQQYTVCQSGLQVLNIVALGERNAVSVRSAGLTGNAAAPRLRLPSVAARPDELDHAFDSFYLQDLPVNGIMISLRGLV